MNSALKVALPHDERLLGIGLTEAEAELGLCELAVSVPFVWATLYRLGVRSDALRLGGHFASLHIAAVSFLDGGRFEFGHNLSNEAKATPALIVPMLDECGRTQNLLAYEARSKRTARWRSKIPILGLDQLHQPRIEPLQVFPDVLDWLRAGREGIVIVDYPEAAKILCNGEPLAVDDIAFGRELAAKLQIGPPRIVVRKNQRAAA